MPGHQPATNIQQQQAAFRQLIVLVLTITRIAVTTMTRNAVTRDANTMNTDSLVGSYDSLGYAARKAYA